MPLPQGLNVLAEALKAYLLEGGIVYEGVMANHARFSAVMASLQQKADLLMPGLLAHEASRSIALSQAGFALSISGSYSLRSQWWVVSDSAWQT